jgi:serine O-acetyltransferase
MQVYDGKLGPYEDDLGSVEWLASCDLRAVPERDSAVGEHITPFLHFKGFKAIQAHRISHVFWRNGMTHLALTVQKRISECWGVDIHPAAKLGGGLMIDHATGVVIGATTCVGFGCTFLHNTTLGSTGKEDGDRHPKLGNNVMVGQGSSTLGNIYIGDNAKIGSQSMVLKDVPGDATVVGNPARVVRINSSSANIFSSKASDRLKVTQQ